MNFRLLIGITFLPLFLFAQKPTKLEKSLFKKDMIQANRLLESKVKRGDSSLLANLAYTYSRLHKVDEAYKYYVLADEKAVAFSTAESIDFIDIAKSKNNNAKLIEKYSAELKKYGYKDAQIQKIGVYSKAEITSMCFNTNADEFGFLPLEKFNIVSATYYNLKNDVENSTVKTYQVGSSCKFSPFDLNNLPNIDSKLHQGPAFVSSDASWVFMTVSRAKPNFKGEFNLEIYFTHKLENGNFSKFKSLPFCKDSFSFQHPFYDEKNKTLFFASNKSGGSGGFDIYKTIWDGNEWQSPIPISQINTAANEVFPFLGKNGYLFYASKPLNGFGGLDLLVYGQDNTSPQLLPLPINSAFDDFGISFQSPISGYFVSNRPGGMGGDDVYSFNLDTTPYNITIVVLDSLSKQPLSDVTANPLATNFNAVTCFTNAAGKVPFQFTSYEDKSAIKFGYTLSLAGYKDFNMLVTPEFSKTKNLEYYCYLSKLDAPSFKVGDDLVRILELNPIYFPLDKSNITRISALELDKVVKLMLENPSMEIELGSHTDSRSSAEYNQNLSQRRADESAAYIVSKGIDSKRLIKVGYGESKLLNNCSDGVPCSKEMHAINRRTEFIIIKM